MAPETTKPLLLILAPPQQHHRRPVCRAWALAVVVAAMVLVLMLPAAGPMRRRMFRLGAPAEPVELTLLAGTTDKGAVCLDGTPPGYHLQRGSGDGANSWIIHLQKMGCLSFMIRGFTQLGSSLAVQPKSNWAHRFICTREPKQHLRQGNYLTYIFSNLINPGRRMVQHTQGLFQPQNVHVRFIKLHETHVVRRRWDPRQ